MYACKHINNICITHGLQEAALESMREAVSQATPLDRNYKKTLLHDPKLSDLLQVGRRRMCV